MELTDEQQAIVTEARRGTGDIQIDALAGCTKTTTLIEVMKVLPQRSILFAAFGKGIATEAEARKPRIPGTLIVVQTFHALGHSIIRKHAPQVTIAKTATEDLVNDACASVFRSAPYEVRRAAVRLVRCAKETLSPTLGTWQGEGAMRCWRGWAPPALVDLGFEQNLFGPKLSDRQIERVVQIAQAAIMLGLDPKRATIDFCDMVWWPLVRELAPPSRYQAILLDEAQDISAPQLELLQRLVLPTTRFIAAGDIWQQIYGWRGSLGARVWDHFAQRRAKRLPLTMTWRCSRAVVQAANELVPHLRAQPNAEEGSVQTCTLGALPLMLAQGYAETFHTFVLSRQNAALLDCALFLWRAGLKFKLNGADEILEPLFAVLDRELDLSSETAFRASVAAWHQREAIKADETGATSRREQLDEQRAMLLAALRYAPPRRLRGLLDGMRANTKSGVLLSTVHKVKGLEADRVFLLKQTFARHAGEPDRASFVSDDTMMFEREIAQEELNIEYVGITRARTHLIWVDIKDRARPDLLTMPVAEIPAAELEAALTLTERAVLHADAEGDAVVSADLTARLDSIYRRMRGY